MKSVCFIQRVRKVAVHLGYGTQIWWSVSTLVDITSNNFSEVHSDFLNADLQKVFENRIKQFQACIEARGHHFKHINKCTATFRTHCIRT
jgi:hypothetical protein